MPSAGTPEAGEAGEERAFPATVEKVTEMVAYVSGRAEEHGFADLRLMQLELAVEEAVVNICSYAYEKPPGEVVVRTRSIADTFVVELVDDGVPFDPLAKTDPDLPDNLDSRVVGGLGILLIRRVMDEVRYRRENGRNVLTLMVRSEG
jgi:serine/threonine-protein kinase RsbW